MTSFRLSTPPMDVAALFLPQSIAEQHDTQVNNKALRIKDIIMNYKEKAIYLTIYLLEDTLFDDDFVLPTPPMNVGVFFLPQFTAKKYVSENKHGLGTKPKQAQHHAIAITEQHPIAIVRKPLPDHVSLERQSNNIRRLQGIEKRNNTDIADLRLEATKRKLNDAYQEAENS
uniref:Uncharacterized protein n=1 Tax=Oryza nivara TaxID=4536 RepID=A0A0E0FK78_ORYNI